jgi:hypothetical protein
MTIISTMPSSYDQGHHMYLITPLEHYALPSTTYPSSFSPQALTLTGNLSHFHRLAISTAR